MRLRLPGHHAPAWVLAESASTALFSMVSLLLVGRVIGPEAMGAATIALAAFLVLDVLAASLFTDALVQLPGLGPRHAGSAVAVGTGAGALAGLLLAGAAPLLAAGSGVPEVAPLALALAPLLPFSAWSGATAGLMLRRHRYRLLAARALAGQPLALALALLLAREGFGAWSVIASQAALTLTTALMLLAFARPLARPALDPAALRELWPVAGPQIAAVAVMVGRYRLFLLALGLVAAPSVVALSHVAFRLLDGALVVVFQSISRISLPRFCAVQADRQRLAEAFGDVAQLQALMGLPICAGVALVAPAMVQALLGPDWADAAAAAQVVGFAAAIGFVYGDANALFVAVGRARRNLTIALSSLALPLGLLALLRPGTPAEVALCWAAPSVVLPPLLGWLCLREIGRSPLWLLRRVAPALLATAAMAAAVLGLQAALPMRAFATLLASTGLGAAVYLAVAAAALRLRMPRALAASPPSEVPRVAAAPAL